MSAKRRLLVSCGEPSGDLYGGELLRHLRSRLGEVEAFGLGGEHLEAQQVTLLAHVRDLAVVGLLEVLAHLRRIRGIFKRLLAEVDRQPPQLAILIDYPDFNLRLARELKRRGVPVVYYVSPQLWAWRAGRMRSIRDAVSRMIVIFPFEEALYRGAGVPVTFVGHPLVDLVHPAPDRTAFLDRLGLDPARPVLAVLPGSRRQEIAHNLPPLRGALARLAQKRKDLQFLLAVAPSLDAATLSAGWEDLPLRLVQGQTHAVLGVSSLALVASGTATVEAALLGTPMIVVYRLSPLTYGLGRPLVRVPHFAMANLIAGRRLVPELIQGEFTPERVASEALALLEDGHLLGGQREGLAEVRRRLGPPGASARAGEVVESMLQGIAEKG